MTDSPKRSWSPPSPQGADGVGPDGPLGLEEQVCFGLSVAARLVVGAYRPLLEPLGLTHTQFLVMVALWQHGQQSVKELGNRLVLDSGTLSPLLKRLEATGLVARRRRDGDERQVLISITERGEQLRRQAGNVNADVVRQLGLDPEELQRLQVALGRVIHSTMGASDGRARPLAADRPDVARS